MDTQSLVGSFHDFKLRIGIHGILDILLLGVDDARGDEHAAVLDVFADFSLQHNDDRSQNVGCRNVITLVTSLVLNSLIIDDVA